MRGDVRCRGGRREDTNRTRKFVEGEQYLNLRSLVSGLWPLASRGKNYDRGSAN